MVSLGVSLGFGFVGGLGLLGEGNRRSLFFGFLAEELVQAVLGFLLVAVDGELIAEDGLEVTHAESETERQFRLFQMDGEKGFVLVEGQIDFVAAIYRSGGSG